MNEEKTENKINEFDLTVFFYDFLQVARRLVFLLLILIVLCAGFLCYNNYRHYSPVYEASATFTVYITDPLQSDVRAYNTAAAEQMAKTFPYIISSGIFNERVMQSLDITYMPSISASSTGNTNIFTITVSSSDPELSYNVLSEVIKYYPEAAQFVVGPTNLNLLDESGIPNKPVNRLSFYSSARTGAFYAALIWGLLCIIKTLLHSTVHNEKELASLINLRELGMLPKVKNQARSAACPLFGTTSETSGFSEAVRLMRIRAENELVKNNSHVIIVSSAIAGEGKTTVSINLGISLAARGKRTLIIDCDLRNPSVAENLGKENINGLTDYLEGSIKIEELIQKTGYSDLSVVYAGEAVSNAAELLARPQTKHFISACRKFYDYVILDTPPVSLLSDAAEIADCADGAILTIRQNYASKREILESAQTLSENGMPIIGYVMNYTSEGIFSSSGSYYYKYGKYYSKYGKYGKYKSTDRSGGDSKSSSEK